MGVHDLPFIAGQEVESRSFIPGFRGAWFRCKIIEIAWRMGQISTSLEYFDFPGEKITWTKIYQASRAYSKKSTKSKKLQLMLRPYFPPVYHESTMPDVNTIVEVVVLVGDVWKVGDLVDWWKDGCYWSGRVTEVLGNEKVKIELPPPPVGEGCSYEVSCKDLRPSLDWSPENGWTVPTTENENGRTCARVMKPGNQGGISSLTVHSVGDGRKGVQAIAVASHPSSQVSASSLQPHDGLEEMAKQPLGAITAKLTPTPETNVDSDMADSGIGKTSCSDSVSSSHIKNASKGMGRSTTGKDRVDNNGSLKKLKTDQSIVLNSMSSDTLEAAILDLEELVNRVKWMKGVLEIGMPLTSAMRPTWKFL